MSNHSRHRLAARSQALLGAVLMLAVVLMANRIARAHLHWRVDLSEDGLWRISPEMRNLLGRLEDPLQVKTFFTGDVKSGEISLAKARLEGLLAEYVLLSGGRMRVDAVDPDTSGEALLEAERYGLTPFEARTMDAMREVRQVVHLGMVLRYRGREQTIPLALPAGFETTFAQKLHDLMRDRKRVVGWYGPDPEPGTSAALWGSFREARERIARRHELRDVRALELGLGVPDDVDLLLVVRPSELHPRAVFELDQFAQGGGHLLIAVEQADVAPDRMAVGEIKATGLDPLLTRWGARVTPQLVWDEQCASVQLTRMLTVGDQRVPQPTMTEYQLFPRLDAASFDRELPPVAGLQQGTFYWAQPIAPLLDDEGLEDVERVEIIRSSEHAWRVDIPERLEFEEEPRASMQRSLYARGSGQRYALAVALIGRLPSPFEQGAPAPHDPIAPEDGGGTAATGEAVLSAASETQVVVVGDSDWMRDGFLGGNERLFDNLVDWMVLDAELLALRARTPRERPLDDFYAEEVRRRGLDALPADETSEQLDRRVREQAAARAATSRRQWRAMLWPVAVSLALVLGLGLLWNRRGGRWSAKAAA